MSYSRMDNTRDYPGAPLGLPAQFRIEVLGQPEGEVRGEITQVAGNRLIAKLSSAVPVNACVRIACDDSFLLGEVLTCWSEGGTVFGVMELRHQLTRLAQLAALHQEYADSPGQERRLAGRRM